MRRSDISPRVTERRSRRAVFPLLLFLLALAVGPLGAQNPSPNPLPQNPAANPLPSPPQPTGQQDKGYKIKRDVDLVVLHTTVLDARGEFVSDLKENNFRVFEDRVEQKISVFAREDIPVSMGLVIDNSGSMREKRPQVNAAALTFVETSNPQDEVFVVNFNEDYYLDLDKDFTNNVGELKEALERIDSRGSTALYDAVIGSMDHLKKGHRDKKVLLVITDGEDNASHKNFEYTLKAAQQSNALIYAIGVFSKYDREHEKKMIKNSKKVLTLLATTTGGLAYFPEDLQQVETTCKQVARDIRNQYTIGYYPTNTAKDGTFRAVKVNVVPPHGRGNLTARTRAGYYAQAVASGD